MPLRKSFLFRLFGVVFCVLLVITGGIEAALYSYARQVVGSEYSRLNQAALTQIATTCGNTLADAWTLARRIADSTQLIELLSGPYDEDGVQTAHDLIGTLNNEYVWQGSGKMLLDAYLIGFNGMTASTYRSALFTFDGVMHDPKYAPLISGERASLLLGTTYQPEATGIFTNSFQAAQLVRDHLTHEALGIVILNISEISLYAQYLVHRSAHNSFAVLDGEGTVVSAQDKRRIGSRYDFTPAELAERNSRTSVNDRIVNGQLYLYARIPGTDWYLVEQMAQSAAFGTLDQLRNITLAVTGVGALLIAAVMIYAYRRILRPVNRLQTSLTQVMDGDFSVRIAVRRDDEFGRIETAFNGMVAQISLLLETVKREEKEKRMAELDFLQAQINPHFIHNTLSSIRFMLELGKTEEAGEMIFFFSKLLRQTLSRSDEFVSLREEMAMLDSYVALQRLRYPDTFDYTCAVDEAVLEQRIPVLLFQPVLENAIFHGVGGHKITIRVTGRVEGGALVVEVADNGVGMSRDKIDRVLSRDLPVNRVGLKNVQDRIRLIYGTAYGLTISGGSPAGTVVTFRLPLEACEQGMGG